MTSPRTTGTGPDEGTEIKFVILIHSNPQPEGHPRAHRHPAAASAFRLAATLTDSISEKNYRHAKAAGSP